MRRATAGMKSFFFFRFLLRSNVQKDRHVLSQLETDLCHFKKRGGNTKQKKKKERHERKECSHVRLRQSMGREEVSGRRTGEANGQTQSEGRRQGCRGGADWAGEEGRSQRERRSERLKTGKVNWRKKNRRGEEGWARSWQNKSRIKIWLCATLVQHTGGKSAIFLQYFGETERQDFSPGKTQT